MKPFRERNPVVVGAVGLLAMALLLVGSFRAESLPLIGGGDVYYAHFSEAGGLSTNDEVRIAGVRVGKVEEVTLEGDRVRVAFRVDRGAEFGPQTGADIKVKTVLGSMMLMLVPAGEGQMEEGATIPLARTTAPFDAVEAFTGLAETSSRINTKQLATSLNTLSDLMKDTPDDIQSALTGLSRLSRTVASRDQQLNTLLRSADKVTKVLADRDAELSKLFRDGQILFRAVYARRQAIHNLLVASIELSQQISGFVRESRADLKPALRELHGVVQLLRQNQENIDESIRLLAPFVRVFTNTLGHGPWWDSWVQNFPPVSVPGEVGQQ